MKLHRLALLLLALATPAQAQNNFTMPPPAGVVLIGAQVVAACGAGSLSATQGFVSINATGALCTNASGGGGFTPTATPVVGTAWTSAIAGNTTQAIATNVGYSGIIVVLQQTSTISAGAVTFEGSYDGTNYSTIAVANQVLNPSTYAPLTNPYTLVASTNQAFLILPQGYSSIRLKLSTPITGSGSVTPVTTLWPTDPTTAALLNATAIAQTTPGTSNGISLAYINTTTVSAGNGTADAGTQRVAVATTDPCQSGTKSYLPITATTSLVKVIATGVSAKKIYVCAIDLVTTAANNVAVFEATTATTCATAAVAVKGAGTSVATAANGYSFPANGGISLGNGGYTMFQTSVNANDLCIGTSAATPLTGGILYTTN